MQRRVRAGIALGRPQRTDRNVVFAGIPLSEVRARGSNRIDAMDQEDIKKIRAVGKVRTR